MGGCLAGHNRQHAGKIAQVIGVLDQALRPGLIAERLSIDDRAHRQGAGRDQHMWSFDSGVLRTGDGLRRRRAGEHVLGHDGSDAGDEQGANQQRDFLDVHGDCRLPPLEL